jgi:HAD superfamily hydrolase (TIGR01509 family)
MDGVIVDSTRTHTQVWEDYLNAHGLSWESVAARMLGKRNDQIVRTLWGDQLPPEEVDRHGFAKEQLYRDRMGPVLEENLVPGIRDFIKAAHSSGTPIGLASNAEPLNVDFILDQSGLRSCFRTIVDGHQVEKPKPDPELYLTAAARLGVATHNCIVFEDSPGGLQAALAAGTRVVGVLTTLDHAPGALLQIKNFLDPHLLPWLSQQRPF